MEEKKDVWIRLTGVKEIHPEDINNPKTGDDIPVFNAFRKDTRVFFDEKMKSICNIRKSSNKVVDLIVDYDLWLERLQKGTYTHECLDKEYQHRTPGELKDEIDFSHFFITSYYDEQEKGILLQAIEQIIEHRKNQILSLNERILNVNINI